MKKKFLVIFSAIFTALLATVIYSAVGDRYIINDNQDGDIFVRINDGGTDTDILSIDGATGTIGVNNTSPESQLHQIGNGNADIDFSVSKGGNNTNVQFQRMGAAYEVGSSETQIVTFNMPSIVSSSELTAQVSVGIRCFGGTAGTGSGFYVIGGRVGSSLVTREIDETLPPGVSSLTVGGGVGGITVNLVGVSGAQCLGSISVYAVYDVP